MDFKTLNEGFETFELKTITSASIIITATPKMTDVDIKCSVYTIASQTLTADQVYFGSGANFVKLSDPETTKVANKLTIYISGLKANSTYRVYCATNDAKKVLRNYTQFTTLKEGYKNQPSVGVRTETFLYNKVTKNQVKISVTPNAAPAAKPCTGSTSRASLLGRAPSN